jgi:glucosamine--fructose-6-phosphate aminotransferase (isomerizing)
MFREAQEAPAAVRSQLDENRGLAEALGQALREYSPRAVVTCGRGSSDHAATFAKYLIETRTGLHTSSAAPSISSLYATRSDLRSVLFVAISQSGASPDLVAAANAAREAGALVVALVNREDSPLARAVHHCVPLKAGPEKSVAATKSYVASLAAILQLVAAWNRDPELELALRQVPGQLATAWRLEWSSAVDRFRPAENLYVIGRGLGLGIAREAALKLKETCGIHAEAFSAAELRHGPMALIEPGFPVLVFAQRDETRPGIEALARELGQAGAEVVLAGMELPGLLTLPAQRAHPAIEPMLMIQSFYRLANAIALARGRDPDRPPHLSKVTETV